MGLAHPSIGNHGLVGKDVQFLQKFLTCYNSRAHGYERSGSFKISGYYGWWMARNWDKLDYNIIWELGLFTKVVI